MRSECRNDKVLADANLLTVWTPASHLYTQGGSIAGPVEAGDVNLEL